jgi:hypothetical protein
VGVVVGAAPGEAAHQHDRLTFGTLPLHQRGGGGDLVGVAGDADLQHTAEQIGLAAQVHQRRQPRRADRDAAGATAPGASEAVVDDHRQLDAVALRECRAQFLGAAIGIDRQQQRHLRTVGVGDV